MPEPLTQHPIVCLTIGDPTGIGPEITAKFLQQIQDQTPLIILGDIENLEETASRLNINLPRQSHIQYENMRTEACKTPGALAYASLEAAVAKIHSGKAHILVTGPISKENLQEDGIGFSGHTEILQYLARKYYEKPYQSDMLFIYHQFRMLLLTRHVSLRKVSEELSIHGVRHSLDNLMSFLQHYAHIEKPKLCVLGVNPHAGELDGDEEERVLKPALKFVASKYALDIDLPKAADAAFRHFDVNHLQADAYVAAYHDQGLIPFKMVAGLEAVNVTIGLPFLRTSVSHGTAPDIAGQGIADPISLLAAYQLALSFLDSPAEKPLLV